jgi:hypothetical protein
MNLKVTTGVVKLQYVLIKLLSKSSAFHGCSAQHQRTSVSYSESLVLSSRAVRPDNRVSK